MENVWNQDSDPQLLKHKPNGNGIRPEEIAALVTYLASDEVKIRFWFYFKFLVTIAS